MRLLSRFLSARPLWRVMLLLVTLLAVQSGIVRAQFTAPPEREFPGAAPGEVDAIKFEGNQALSSDELATVIATKASGIWSTRLYRWTLKLFGAPRQKLEMSTLTRDTAALNLYYRDHGFLLARSTFTIGQNSNDLKLFNDYLRHEKLMRNPNEKKSNGPPSVADTVTFHIHEGPPFTISRVALAGLETLPNQFQPELTEHVTIKTGQQWSRAAAAKEIDRLTGIMIENGYPNFRYDTVVVENLEGRTTVNVSIYFTPGHRYRYGAVSIIYDTNTAEPTHVAIPVIKAQLMTDSGAWYKLSDIQRTEANLMKLGTFDLARVSLDTGYIRRLPDSLRDGAAIPLQVLLRMRRRQEVPLNVYAGTGSQGTVFGGGIGYTNRNLSQTADNFNFQVSYQPIPYTQQRFSASLDYLLPYIGLGRIPLITGLGLSRDIQREVSDTNIHAFTDTSASFHIGSNIIISQIDNRTALTPDLLFEFITGKGDSLIEAKGLLPHKQYNLLPSISYQDDRTNDPINPTEGNLISFSAELGWPDIKIGGHSSSAYLKLVPQIKFYHDLGTTGGDVIAARLRVGGSRVIRNGQFPSYNHRFFGGGASSNRGWTDQALLVSADSNAPVNQGGYNDLEFNLEYRYAPFRYAQEFTSWQKLSSPVRFVLFYDAGNVWDNILWDYPKTLSLHFMAQTIGLGFRYNTFFGALRADWGLKLYDPSGEFSTNTTPITPSSSGAWIFGHHLFGLGTSNWHFGVGQAF
ncbi:MAG: BamA/TamA family outer membrane protein [Bacteroidota bacterium]|nr:BamA/TamA family outer membrane protein [Bacteroidota bacterium]MDP4232609.1 BamA/TamA family outer membrane protein [Bacteroidota bacterium]MDP4242937.1 BamA/TamA family outer membrane protein [Bacteroidota bacterium]MDP4286488.1 BamA/TamA family outer membrane protein [Bacteroidota bacterium]